MRPIPEGVLPPVIMDGYQILNWRNAVQILAGSYPAEFEDIIDILGQFRLRKSDILAKGRNKSTISGWIDSAFEERGWEERRVAYTISIDKAEHEAQTHKIDCFRNRVGLEIEWNSKDQTFVRDLNTFRILFDLRILDVGIIVTRCDHLQQIFDSLGVGGKYGASTTHMSKLQERIEGGGGGGCPVLVFGISKNLYDPTT